ncbi:MAG: hypothetical protein IJF37_04470 [Lachnospiraceae bacterium]|nr:hypothetical protein [Lachnospiraceae bacterium]
MPSNKPKIVIRTTDELIAKFDIIAKQENRSMSNLGETIIKLYIENYEKNHGNINTVNIGRDNNGSISF